MCGGCVGVVKIRLENSACVVRRYLCTAPKHSPLPKFCNAFVACFYRRITSLVQTDERTMRLKTSLYACDSSSSVRLPGKYYGGTLRCCYQN